MDKKIAFFTEMPIWGKISRDHPNMKTMEAWICALDADHISLQKPSEMDTDYDLGIVVIPKNWFKFRIEQAYQVIEHIKNVIKPTCKKIAMMQEGPHDYFQDYSVKHQFVYYHSLFGVDFLLCHNASDISYFKGLTGKNTYLLQSLMIEKSGQAQGLPQEDVVMIGGNMVSWYGGFDSYIVAREMNIPVYGPSMGRKQEGEDSIEGIEYLPYMDWDEWIVQLSKMRYGVHLMRTYAAGTFALNCSYLGIPCIGYEDLDTQNILHINTTVEEGDIVRAREIAHRLKHDEFFYNNCVCSTKHMYEKFYTEEKFLEKFNEILEVEKI